MQLGKSSAMNQEFYIPGQVALITGGNVGIGRITAIELAKKGFKVVIAGRSLERTQAVLDDIKSLKVDEQAIFLPLDLASLASVRECAQLFLQLNLPLHLLVNNAGVAGLRGLTKDGFEMTFGVNHLGHFLLTQLLLEKMQSSGLSRIVTVSSRAHNRTAGINWDALCQPTRSWTGIHEYAVSKLANLLFSAELTKRVQGTSISTYSLHPGVVDTEIWRALPNWARPLLKLRGFLTPEEGARTTLHCAMHAPQQESGLYYADSKPKQPSALGQNSELAAELWERSEKWVSQGLNNSVRLE
ncbi:SDR family oxidoreductase [Limnohabitans sp. MMS-10A-178]|jgi:retinol dehydrogenase-12|uniref:SDR family oxidoreductase n=1 Tax=Limnohabitans sp. MMS-10A-178 TaxID=1835767 RepID=UPI0018EE847C|nr:SDR family oxidoreductase [Limnohabitans sp. MMS-10A-178]